MSKKSEILHIQTSFVDAVESVFGVNSMPKTIKLIWSPHPNPSVKSYIIERLDSQGEFKSIGSSNHRLSVEFFDKNLQDGETYTYRIIAKTYEGIKSKPSNILQVSTIKQPDAINNVQASNDLARQILLQWDEAPDSAGVKQKKYKVLYSSNDKQCKVAGTTTKTTFTHKIQEDGARYYYQVLLLGENGLEGKYSAESSVGSTLPKPSPVRDFKAFIQNGNATLKWETPSDSRIDSFIVYRKESWGKELKYSDIRKDGFVDKEMQQGKKYKYSVVSVDSNGIESVPSIEIELSKD